jgi:hypothetical protein
MFSKNVWKGQFRSKILRKHLTIACALKLPCYFETGCQENVWQHGLVVDWRECVCCYAAKHPSHVSPHLPESNPHSALHIINETSKTRKKLLWFETCLYSTYISGQQDKSIWGDANWQCVTSVIDGNHTQQQDKQCFLFCPPQSHRAI